MNRNIRLLLSAVALAALAGCASFAQQGVPNAPACTTSANMPNARYVGAYLGVENVLSANDMARDLHCANEWKAKHFPKGYVTIFGSSRIREKNAGPDAAVNAANDKVYADIKTFATVWTQRYGNALPIMSGAGPGIMEAAHRGASEAGRSIGYTTYYDTAATPTPDKPYGGNPAQTLARFGGKDIVTDAFIFTSVSMRETLMVLHSAAMIVAPGGSGTEWETFQLLESIKSRQVLRVPVILFGDRTTHWASFEARLADMTKRGTIRPNEVTQFVEFIADPNEMVERLATQLKLK
jgi:predicted Rossmann-fold nucleotide-binding protein